MPRLSMWNQRKGNNYNFIDHHVRLQFQVGGTGVLVHKYSGPAIDNEGASEISIQDLLFQENRDRLYDPHVYELRGVYQVNDNDFDLGQFGVFLTSDNLFISFHLNDMIRRIGRKLMSGDVLELQHLRDENLLDPSAPPINRYYVVQDANNAQDGFSQTWWPHIWRVRVSPLYNQQEYFDILLQPAVDEYGRPIGVKTDPGNVGNPGAGHQGSGTLDPNQPITTLADIISTDPIDQNITDAIIARAEEDVPRRFIEERNLWVLPPCEGPRYRAGFMSGDGVPPNGAALAGSGASFPENPQPGDYWLRTDYSPAVLFQWDASGAWQAREVDMDVTWSAANEVLRSHINNSETLTTSFGTEERRTSVRRAFRPKENF